MAIDRLTHLRQLEAESIHVFREAVAELEHPVLLYSVGKDSSVLLHLARKAFHPGPVPFPLLHIDSGWNFRDMITFRDALAERLQLDLRVYVNPEAVERGIDPFTADSRTFMDVTATRALRQALELHGFDAAFGGGRRDEEKSRAKERFYSMRDRNHRWDPKNQRPELWNLYNGSHDRGDSVRVFPLSNWTELDVWQYIHLEGIDLVPLYLSKPRPVVKRHGQWIVVDDERMPLEPGEEPELRRVRFRTLGDYPLSGAVESDADTLPAIIQEMLLARTSEREGRVIDHDSDGSMERKKREGYF